MIKIIKPGKTVFNVTCGRCGCEFTYELEDLHTYFGSEYVRCSECSHDSYHPRQDDKWAKNQIDLQPPFGTTSDSISNDLYNCMQGNHEWECVGMSTVGTSYRCRRCGIQKTEQNSNMPNVINCAF